jgi:hypothetical protein
MQSTTASNATSSDGYPTQEATHDDDQVPTIASMQPRNIEHALRLDPAQLPDYACENAATLNFPERVRVVPTPSVSLLL